MVLCVKVTKKWSIKKIWNSYGKISKMYRSKLKQHFYTFDLFWRFFHNLYTFFISSTFLSDMAEWKQISNFYCNVNFIFSYYYYYYFLYLTNIYLYIKFLIDPYFAAKNMFQVWAAISWSILILKNQTFLCLIS